VKPAAQAAAAKAASASDWNAATRSAARWQDFVALTKPRLNLLVLATTAGGLYLAAPEGVPAALLVHTLLGTALVAGGAAAFNQVWERQTDGLMPRTRTRPVPAGRVASSDAAWFAAALSLAGLVELAVGATPLGAAMAALTLLSYVLVYTPLKKRTSLATLIGAVPGALPPVIGWTAAGGGLTLEALVLFGIVFLWQMPHFLAIAWLYRRDYAAAGIPLLPVVEPDGRSTGRQALVYTAALWPVSLMPTLIGLTGAVYLVVAAVLGGILLVTSAAFARERSTSAARRLFLFSITYLPLLWIALVADRLWI
jgi:protoheme IX farnesyltransferase